MTTKLPKEVEELKRLFDDVSNFVYEVMFDNLKPTETLKKSQLLYAPKQSFPDYIWRMSDKFHSPSGWPPVPPIEIFGRNCKNSLDAMAYFYRVVFQKHFKAKYKGYKPLQENNAQQYHKIIKRGLKDIFLNDHDFFHQTDILGNQYDYETDLYLNEKTGIKLPETKPADVGKGMTRDQNNNREPAKSLIQVIERFIEKYQWIEEWFQKEISFSAFKGTLYSRCYNHFDPMHLMNSKNPHDSEILFEKIVLNWIQKILEKFDLIQSLDRHYLDDEFRELIDVIEDSRLYLYRNCYLGPRRTPKTINTALESAKKIYEGIYSIREIILGEEGSSKEIAEEIISMQSSELVHYLSEKERLERIQRAALLAKAIDDLGLRRLAGLDRQAKIESKKMATSDISQEFLRLADKLDSISNSNEPYPFIQPDVVDYMKQAGKLLQQSGLADNPKRLHPAKLFETVAEPMIKDRADPEGFLMVSRNFDCVPVEDSRLTISELQTGIPVKNDIHLASKHLRRRAGVYADVCRTLADRIQATPTVEGEEKLPELNDTEREIITALGEKSLKGEALTKKAELPYNSNTKATLSSLVKRRILGNTKNKGYFLKPEYCFLLSQKQGQD